MIAIENECVGCPIHCIDCGRKHVVHYYCDECGEEADLYNFDGQELCAECILSKFEKIEHE